MIRYTTGNLLDDPADALVNAVNCVGVMGRGIALEFKKRFPENFQKYQAACLGGEIHVGFMFVTKEAGKTIINFPTKKHWRNRSHLSWIETGLRFDLRRIIILNDIRSIAIPALGCGLGGLPWDKVRYLIEDGLGRLDGVDVVVYEPAEEM